MKKLKLFTIPFLMMFLVFAFGIAKAQETIYSESFGIIEANTNIEDHTDFDETNVTYSVSAATVNLRMTNSSANQYALASGEANVFLNTQDAWLQVEGINTSRYNNLTLSFGYRKGLNAATLADFRIEYSTDGTTWTEIVPTYWTRGLPITQEGTPDQFPTTSSTGWYYVTCAASANTIPTTDNLYLKFTNLRLSGNNEVRIDDILLVGDRIPYVAIISPEDGAVLSPCDTVTFDIDIQDFTLYSSFPPPSGDGFLKIESELLEHLPIPNITNPYYCDQLTAMALANYGGMTLPEGEYDITVSLVGLDSLPLTPPATHSIHISVIREVVADPEFSLPEGTYNTPQVVEITTTTEGAIIYYTVDGTEPDETSLVYTEPINVDSTMTISAVAMKECATTSEVITATYEIEEEPSAIAHTATSSIRISPNPATDLITITAKGYNQVEIVNFLGQVVYQNDFTDVRQINIADLNAGIYFVRLKGDTTITKKFIKK